MADLDQRGATREARGQAGTGGVDDDLDAVASEITSESPVGVGWDHRRHASGQDAGAGVERGDQRRAVEGIEVMTGERGRCLLGDDPPLPRSSVVNVRSIRGVDGHFTEFEAFPFDERAQHRPGLSTKRGAERDLGSEPPHHPSDPHSLTARVEVQLGAVISP